MKKIIIITLVLVLSFSGCKNSEECNIAPAGYSFDAKITVGDFNAAAYVSVFGGGILKIQFKSPENISGLCFEITENNCALSKDGIDFVKDMPAEKTGELCVLSGAFMRLITAGQSAKKAGACFEYNGVYNNNEFKFIINNEGFPTRLEIPKINLISEFSNWKY